MQSLQLLFGILLGTLCVSVDCTADDGKPPNILFIFSDDHAYQAVSAYGHPLKLNETPNIDRIAKDGMRFDRCLIPNSICGPSRACVLTGKYNHVNGFYNNTNSRFDGSQMTFPKLLQKAGYQTAMIGKWHLESDPTGFDHWLILPGQGIYYNPPMILNGVRSKQTGYVTDIITDRSLDWMKNRDPKKPFLLMCQHKAPHREWAPALRHLGHDRDRKYPEPDTLFDDYAGRGKAEKNQDMTLEKTFTELDAKLKYPPGMTDAEKPEWDKYYAPRNEAFTKANLSGKELVRWRYNRYLHDYLGCIHAVDESVGKLLDYLEKEGLSENTIVVYMADQGFYLGEHGWFDKRWIFEESLRTPCLIRWPGVTKSGSSSNAMTSNIDFAPTFLAAAGVPIPAQVQGRDLKAVLKSDTPADWRKSFYYHYYEYPGPHSVAKHYGVVTEKYKLVRFYEKEFDYWELFDTQKDPNELTSVYDRPEYATVRKELEVELSRLRQQLKVPDTDPPETELRKK
jgi:arylsulfatase A-like enzyme